MKETARLIIPAWGELYINKILSLTLPAILAPGNLPALSEMFNVEIVIVTESRLFEPIRASQAFNVAAKICKIQLVPLDDLLVNLASDYGVVLTCALFRGFADLGAHMTEVHLLFLNADFIVSNDSLRHVGQLMLQGKRLIHAPSFRVVLEDVWPELERRVDPNACILSLSSREMAKLALAHKHPTVRARTVNQRLCHQKWMDQFYWYVDEETLIGYQSPVALVAIKPERHVTEPALVWDFAFIPEAAPTLVPHYITDSDEFFMIEPQSRETGCEMIRIGWLPVDEIAADLSVWLTKEQRESSKQLVTIHAGDLPADLANVIGESRTYMADIYRRLSPKPAPHIAHPRLGQWFEDAKERQRRSSDGGPQQPAVNARGPLVAMLRALQGLYGRMFGSYPNVGASHALWMDIVPVARKIAGPYGDSNPEILWIKAADWWQRQGIKLNPAVLADGPLRGALYELCICEVTFNELLTLDRLYQGLRPLIKDGGRVIFRCVRPKNAPGRVELLLDNFPDIDFSEIHFYGTSVTTFLHNVCVPALRPVSTRPLVRGMAICALIALAPLVRLANAYAARRDSTIFSAAWSILLLEFTVKRSRPQQSKTSI
jgi:hypothetical protein